MKYLEALGALVGLAAVAHGHMEMSSPPPLRSKHNPNTPDGLKDYSMTSPLSAGGGDFPCKGSLNLLGQPAGKAVAEWMPGQTVTIEISGAANHNGGSCQASLSHDGGKTFRVVYSWIGSCPTPGASTWSFPLPGDTPAGEAVFAWTWFNQVGNREMYMNCAVVDIKAAAGGKRGVADVAFTARPDIFVANVNNGLCTYEGRDVEFPHPGPNLSRNSSKDTQAPGVGSCVGEAAGQGNAPPPPPPPAALPVPPPPVALPAPPAPPVLPSPVVSQLSSTKAPGNVFITKPLENPPAPTSSLAKPQPYTSSSRAAGTTTPALPAQPPSSSQSQHPSVAPSPPPSSSSDAATPGSKCASEGQWRCIAGGSQFQRCASGLWSVPMSLARGTSCHPGVSDNLLVIKRGGHDGAARPRLGHRHAHGRRLLRS